MAGLRIVHTADTHLGYSAYQRLVPEGEPYAGLNQREADVYTAWHALIDTTIEHKPDIFLHAGDLFDAVRPSNRALHEAITGLRRLIDSGIPAVLIAGNHETPRLRETGHVFRLLENFPGLYPIYKGPPEEVMIPGLEQVNIVGVPHSHGVMEGMIARAAPNPDKELNLLVLHGTVTGLQLPSKELNQAEISSGLLKSSWNYIALGHYHCFTQVEPNTYYCGSTERFSFNEAKEDKGPLLVELPGPRVNHLQIAVREFVDLPWVDVAELQGLKSASQTPQLPEELSDQDNCSNPVSGTVPLASKATQLTFEDLTDPTNSPEPPLKEQHAPTIERSQIDLNGFLHEALRACRPEGKVIRQRVLNCPPELYRLVDYQALRKFTREAVHYMPQFELAAPGEAVSTTTYSIGALEEEFREYLGRQPLEGFDRNRMETLGTEFLSQRRATP